MRKDLKNIKGDKVHTGKLISQGAHASLKAYKQADRSNSAFKNWDEGVFTKITLSVPNEEELLRVFEKATSKGLNVALILDRGLTEFNNVETNTCLAIGPHWDDEINEVTKELSLY